MLTRRKTLFRSLPFRATYSSKMNAQMPHTNNCIVCTVIIPSFSISVSLSLFIYVFFCSHFHFVSFAFCFDGGIDIFPVLWFHISWRSVRNAARWRFCYCYFIILLCVLVLLRFPHFSLSLHSRHSPSPVIGAWAREPRRAHSFFLFAIHPFLMRFSVLICPRYCSRQVLFCI